MYLQHIVTKLWLVDKQDQSVNWPAEPNVAQLQDGQIAMRGLSERSDGDTYELRTLGECSHILYCFSITLVSYLM